MQLTKESTVAGNLKLPGSPRASSLELEKARLLTDKDAHSESMKTARSAIELGAKVVGLCESIVKLKSTQEEWRGKIGVAEAEVRVALVELERSKVDASATMEQLSQKRAAQEKLLAAFDHIFDQISQVDLTDEQESQKRQLLLDMSKLLVELHKR